MVEQLKGRKPSKAVADDFTGRFREIISDPLNLLIDRQPESGVVDSDGFVLLHNGNRVSIEGEFSYYGDFSRILELNRGVHEPLEEYVFQQVLERLGERPRMLELGAYWAHYSMWLKRKQPMADVTLVEPEAFNLAVGQHNFEINGYRGEFLQKKVGRGHFSVDEFLDERQMERLDILHSDIQGFELEMLEGCSKSLARRAIDYLFISTHSQKLHTSVTQLVEAAGYRLEISSDYDSETTSYDGLIFASSMDIPSVFANFRPLGRVEIANASPRELLCWLKENALQA